MTDEIEYRTYGMTVWFGSMPAQNPFKIVSEYGEARSIGRGNVFDEADIYKEALEEIMRIVGETETVYDIARDAVDRVEAAGWAAKNTPA